MMRAVVVVLGSDHHNALGVIRSLGIRGIKSYFILSTYEAKLSDSFVAKSRYLLGSYKTEGIDDLKTSLSIIKEQRGVEKAIIYTTCDSAALLVESYQEKYNDLSIITFTANYKTKKIADLLDKELVLEIARGEGFIIPKTFYLELDSFLKNPKCLNNLDVPYPCIIKPSNSTLGVKSDIIVCYNENQLLLSLRKITKSNKVVVIQEYIEKDFELSIIGVSTLNSGKVIVPGIIKKIREYPKNRGSSSFSVYKANLDIFVDMKVVKSFIEKLNYKGLFSIEFVSYNGALYFLEINLRNDGNGYIPTRCGINLPYIWYRDVLGKSFKESNVFFKDHYFMIESSDFNYLRKYKMSIFKWLKDVFRTDTFMVFSVRDIKPFFCKFLRFFK